MGKDGFYSHVTSAPLTVGVACTNCTLADAPAAMHRKRYNLRLGWYCPNCGLFREDGGNEYYIGAGK